jgi:RNA-binding protein YhbY
LDNAKLWEKGKLKEHFVELSFILRSYLTSRYTVSLLEKTSFETKLILAKKGLNEGTIVAIARILSESDMVKFAKSEPELMAILKVSTLAKQIVAETSPLEFDNAK